MSSVLLLRAFVPARAPEHPELSSGSTVVVGHCMIVFAAMMICPLTFVEYRGVNGRSAALASAGRSSEALSISRASVKKRCMR